MQKAGGIVGIIAGVFGVPAAIVTLSVGGLAGAFKADNASTVIGLGFGGILFSFLCIVFGAIAISAASRLPAILLALSALAGIVLGGTLVAVFMALAFVGGIIALLRTGQPIVLEEATPPVLGATADNVTISMKWVWGAAAMAGFAFVVVLFVLAKQSYQASTTASSPPLSQAQPRLAAAPTPSPAPATVPQAKVEIKLNSYNCSRAHGYMKVEGEVTNISNSPIKGLAAVASHYSSDGTFVRSDTGMIEYNPLMPGQTSPFRAMGKDNPMTSKCKVEFKRILGGKVEFLQ